MQSCAARSKAGRARCTARDRSSDPGTLQRRGGPDLRQGDPAGWPTKIEVREESARSFPSTPFAFRRRAGQYRPPACVRRCDRRVARPSVGIVQEPARWRKRWSPACKHEKSGASARHFQTCKSAIGEGRHRRAGDARRSGGGVTSVAGNAGARLFPGTSAAAHGHARQEGDSILAEQLDPYAERLIPRHLFQQLIAKASDDVRKRLEGERPEMCEQIWVHSVVDVTGSAAIDVRPGLARSFRGQEASGDGAIPRGQSERGQHCRLRAGAQARGGHDRDVAVVGAAARRDRARAGRRGSRDAADPRQGARLRPGTPTWRCCFSAPRITRITARELSDLEREFGRLNVATIAKRAVVLPLAQERRFTRRPRSPTRGQCDYFHTCKSLET